MSTVLVSGGTGFIGSHAVLQLLKAGYTVRTTVRNLKREEHVRSMLRQGGVEAGNRLAVFAADLEQDAGWREAVTGCEYVLHVASPILSNLPKNEDEMIVPAREGALRVLRAARDAGVKRVVLTSSFGAIAYGHPPRTTPFDESIWTNLNGDVPPYQKSKTIAERAAWDFIAAEGNGMELSVVNPTGVLGPTLGDDVSPSLLLVKRLLDGAMPGCPRLNFGFIDVRDVADLHLRAMTHPAASGERFIAVSGESLSMLDIAKVLKKHLGAAAKRVPLRELPNWLVRIAALRNPELKLIVPQLGRINRSTSEKAIRMLGWSPRSNEESIVDTAKSLMQLGLLKDSAAKATA